MQFRARKSKIFIQNIRAVQIGIIFICLIFYVGLSYYGVFNGNDIHNGQTDRSAFKGKHFSLGLGKESNIHDTGFRQ